MESDIWRAWNIWNTEFERGHGISWNTEFEKHSLKIFISSSLSDTTFTLTVSDIFSSVNFLSARHGFTVSQNYFLSVTDLTSRLLKKYF